LAVFHPAWVTVYTE